MHCRRGGVIYRRGGIRRIGAPFRRSRGTFRRRGAGCGAPSRSGERRAAQGFAPARRSGRPKGTRGRFDANRRAIRRRTIGFHGVVLFFLVNELGSGRTLWVRPRRRGVFRLSVGRGRPAVRRHVGRTRTPRGKSFRPCAVSGGLRRGERSCAGQILSPVRRVGRPSPRGAFLRGANPFARAPCREAFAVGSVLARGKSFARAPCREAFAEESLLAWGKSFRPCAVSGGLR